MTDKPKKDASPTPIPAILGEERWYGDGDPSWENAPGAQATERQRRSYVKRLRKFADEFSAAMKLADRIDVCGPGDRCMSGACPECVRAFQRELLRLSVRTLERHRFAGTGPRFTRLGRLIRYREQDLTDWVEMGLRTSKSQALEGPR